VLVPGRFTMDGRCVYGGIYEPGHRTTDADEYA
jgi:hypothetical protein